jgi:hypothetical protein
MTTDLIGRAELTVYRAPHAEVVERVTRYDRRAATATVVLRNRADGSETTEVLPVAQLCLSVGGVLIDDGRVIEQLGERAERVTD